MLRLRPFRKNDAKEIIKWTSRPDEFYMWSAGRLGDFPVSEEKMLEATSGREENDKYFPFTAFDENGPVGFFTVRTPGEDDKKVRLGYIIVDPSIRGKGYGKEMLKLGLKFIFEIYGAESVSLGVFEDNPNAYRCYKGIGFEENGEKEDIVLGGKTWRIIDLEIKRYSSHN